jgi:hypothetical protein
MIIARISVISGRRIAEISATIKAEASEGIPISSRLK